MEYKKLSDLKKLDNNPRTITQEDMDRFIKLKDTIVPVDYSKLMEDDDNTNLISELGCASGQCEIL